VARKGREGLRQLIRTAAETVRVSCASIACTLLVQTWEFGLWTFCRSSGQSDVLMMLVMGGAAYLYGGVIGVIPSA
jgi:branched-chain amino acid transport system permease protein